MCPRVSASVCPPTGARLITSGSGGGGGVGRSRAGHDTTGLPIGACLLSQGAHRACSPPPQHLTRHGDDVLAAGGRGGAGPGGRAMIVGSAIRPHCATLRPTASHHTHRWLSTAV